MLAAIRGVESRIALQKRDMKDKDRAISEAERAISALKADNSELEKFKFVLDHQIKQLKRQIEPRDSEIASIKHSIAAIDQRLETDHAGKKTVHAHIAQLAQHNQHRMARINRYGTADARRRRQHRSSGVAVKCRAALTSTCRLLPMCACVCSVRATALVACAAATVCSVACWPSACTTATAATKYRRQ